MAKKAIPTAARARSASAPGHSEALLAAADRLHSTAIHLLRYARAQDSEMGLSPARASALSVLVFGGPMRLNELARAEGVRAPTVAQIVAALVRDGLARKRPDPRDARAVQIAATAKGKRMLHHGRTLRVRRVADKLAELNAEELRAVERATELIEQRLVRR